MDSIPLADLNHVDGNEPLPWIDPEDRSGVAGPSVLAPGTSRSRASGITRDHSSVASSGTRVASPSTTRVGMRVVWSRGRRSNSLSESPQTISPARYRWRIASAATPESGALGLSAWRTRPAHLIDRLPFRLTASSRQPVRSSHRRSSSSSRRSRARRCIRRRSPDSP